MKELSGAHFFGFVEKDVLQRGEGRWIMGLLFDKDPSAAAVEGGGAVEEGEERGQECGRLFVGGVDVEDVERGALVVCKGFEGGQGQECGLALYLEKGYILFDGKSGGSALIDEGGMGSSAAEGLKTNGPATGKEIEKTGSLDFCLADIENGGAEFFGCGACEIPFGGDQLSSFIDTGGDADHDVGTVSKDFANSM